MQLEKTTTAELLLELWERIEAWDKPETFGETMIQAENIFLTTHGKEVFGEVLLRIVQAHLVWLVSRFEDDRAERALAYLLGKFGRQACRD